MVYAYMRINIPGDFRPCTRSDAHVGYTRATCVDAFSRVHGCVRYYTDFSATSGSNETESSIKHS